jgi:hypothetical protein
MIKNRRGSIGVDLLLLVFVLLGLGSSVLLGIDDTEPAATSPAPVPAIEGVLHTGMVANVEYPVTESGYGPTIITFEDGAIYTLPGTSGWRPVSVWKYDRVSIISTPHGLALSRSWP